MIARITRCSVSVALLAWWLVSCGGQTDTTPGESTATASTALSASVVDTSGWVHVPGALVDPHCVHGVPDGATVKQNGDILLNSAVIAHYGPCPNAAILSRPHPGSNPATAGDLPSSGPATSGWVEAMQAHIGGDQFAYLTDEFTVPAKPVTQNDGQLIFIFPALEPETQNAIWQPVLQWGATTAGGNIGNWSSWTYAAWIQATNGQFYHSTNPITVQVGDVLSGQIGVIDFAAPSTELWLIEGYDTNNTGLGTPFVFAESVGLSWTWAYGAVLEAQNIKNTCNDFPGGTSGDNLWTVPTTSDLAGNTISPTWSSCVEPASCFNPQYSGPTCNFAAGPFFGDFLLGM